MMTWQPIETAPKDGTVIDVYGEGTRVPNVEWGTDEQGFTGWLEPYDDNRNGRALWAITPTHWMPVPKARHCSLSQTQREGTEVRALNAEDILAALRESDPDAYISEQEAGWFVIDGRFNLGAAAQKLCETLDRRLASLNAAAPNSPRSRVPRCIEGS